MNEPFVQTHKLIDAILANRSKNSDEDELRTSLHSLLEELTNKFCKKNSYQQRMEFWKKLAGMGEFARSQYMQLTTQQHRKQLGQFFTPETISALACAATILPDTKSVIDPMCGLGAMLWTALTRLDYQNKLTETAVTGVELDPLAALIAQLPPGERFPYSGNLNVITADAFLELTEFHPKHGKKHFHTYDAIVGNPPYIRYQNLAQLFKNSDQKLYQLFKDELSSQSDSVIANNVIRASLLAHLLDEGTLEDKVRQAVSYLRSQYPPDHIKPHDAVWMKLVSTYSGLADLSLPSWLLTWTLAKENARIALVTTASWRNREYARHLRYFMHRMLQPILVIEQTGNWFNNALVPTTLMVFRARSKSEVAISLQERRKSDKSVRLVRIHKEYNISNSQVFQNVVQKSVPDITGTTTDNLSVLADSFIKWIQALEVPITTKYLSVSIVPEQNMIDELLQEDRAAQRAGASGSSLQEMEYPHRSSVTQVNSFSKNRAVLPNSFTRELHLPTLHNDIFLLPSDYGLEIRQGLRTGCNPFFYVRIVSREELSEEFSNYDNVDVQKIILDSLHDSQKTSRLLENLEKAGILIGYKDLIACQPIELELVRLSKEFGSRLALFPKQVLEPVVRYQQALKHFAVLDPSTLRDRALVIRNGVAVQDYSRLVEKYPNTWREVWKKRDGLYQLPTAISKFIEQASVTILKGKKMPISEMSAVAPNVSFPTPMGVTSLPIESSVPSAPSWWYTLTIKQRHVAPVFIPRVNSKSPIAYRNSVKSTCLIDANFSTIDLSDKSIFTASSLLALFNSIWVKTLLEFIATPMGGGALKVESAHLRTLPLPHIHSRQIEILDNLGTQLSKIPVNQTSEHILMQIDNVVCQAVAGMISVDANDLYKKLNESLKEMQTRRTHSKPKKNEELAAALEAIRAKNANSPASQMDEEEFMDIINDLIHEVREQTKSEKQ